MEDVNAVKQSDASPRQSRYEVLDLDQIVEQMFATIRDVNSVLPLNLTVLRILLAFSQWDRERLLARYRSGTLRKMLKQAKITDPRAVQFSCRDPNNTTATTGVEAPGEERRNGNCKLCYSAENLCINLGCRHVFCPKCWSSYLELEIMKELQPVQYTCPAYSCEALVDDQTVLQLVNDAEAKLRYKEKIIESYVECNKLMRWCPRDQCRHVVKVADPKFRPVQCVCGMKFCFSCGNEWHEPADCVRICIHRQRRQEELMASKWIAGHTKECPACKAPIEKINGCNKMICRNRDCLAEFCWVCLRGAFDHGTRRWCP